jgi:glycosyltransferase involved in cell wall biosynthesis
MNPSVPELPRVSVVAPTYQRRHGLPRFVEPLLAEPDLFELVVAVDGSTDGSVEWLRERAAKDPRLKVLPLRNGGAGPARQAGIEAATGEVVVLLDDDVIAEPGLVPGHARHHAQLEPKLVLGYMPNDWTTLPPDRRAVGKLYLAGYEHYVERYRRDPEFVLTGLWGGNLSMPREQFLRVRMDELAIARGQDDREFGIRCHKAGIRGVFDPSLRALHLYDRPLDAYRRDCRVMGESLVLMRDVHPEVVAGDLVRGERGVRPEEGVGVSLPGPVRRIWPLLARDPALGVVTGALGGLFALGVRANRLAPQILAARAIGSLETMRGVLDRS